MNNFEEVVRQSLKDAARLARSRASRAGKAYLRSPDIRPHMDALSAAHELAAMIYEEALAEYEAWLKQQSEHEPLAPDGMPGLATKPGPVRTGRLP